MYAPCFRARVAKSGATCRKLVSFETKLSLKKYRSGSESSRNMRASSAVEIGVLVASGAEALGAAIGAAIEALACGAGPELEPRSQATPATDIHIPRNAASLLTFAFP